MYFTAIYSSVFNIVFQQNDWPSSLIQFSQDCQRLTLPVLVSKSSTEELNNENHWISEAPREVWRGMNLKKKEEVKMMSAFVHQECERLRIRNIVDLGSGLVSLVINTH